MIHFFYTKYGAGWRASGYPPRARVIVPLRGTIWGGGAVSLGFVPLRGTHLGFDSLAALRAACTFGADNEGDSKYFALRTRGRSPHGKTVRAVM